MIITPMNSLGALARHAAIALFPSLTIRPEDAERGNPLGNVLYFYTVEGGYFHIQATKPDTVGESLWNPWLCGREEGCNYMIVVSCRSYELSAPHDLFILLLSNFLFFWSIIIFCLFSSRFEFE